MRPRVASEGRRTTGDRAKRSREVLAEPAGLRLARIAPALSRDDPADLRVAGKWRRSRLPEAAWVSVKHRDLRPVAVGSVERNRQPRSFLEVECQAEIEKLIGGDKRLPISAMRLSA